MKTNKYILTLALTICCALGNLYAITSAYYSTIDGKKDSGLREALTVLLYNNHTKGLSYDWDFDGIDWDSNGNVYDIYSSCGHKKTDETSSYKCCCDAINREHVVPQSTFDSKPPQYADRHHLYVVDGKANGYRSNYAFGECSGGTKGSCSNSSTVIPSEGTKTCSNHEFGKLGTSTFTEVKISDKVYEPGDEYKGDIARAIMYMVVRYATADYCKVKSGSGTSANAYPVTAWSASSNCGLMFSNTLDTNYGLSAYGKALLLKWHRNDPVSAREITRNEGVAAKQGNRNPFIDYPCLAEYLWGNKVGETVNLSELTGTFTGSWTTGDGCPCGDVPAITLPTGDIFVGSTEANTAVTKTITVQGVNLTANLSLAVSGTNSSLFSLNANTIQKAVAEAGSTVTITYRPTAAGNHSAVLTISGGGLSSNATFNLTGTCCNPYSVTLSRNGITETLGACGTYALPTADDEADPCDGWEFKGWIKSNTSFAEGQTSAPSFTTSVTSATTLYAVYGKTETTGGGSSTSATYTFKSKSWTATEGNWTSGKDGAGYSNSGVQVTAGASGANATCPNSYNTITGITVSYCTNSSSGAGSITMGVGSTELTQTVTKTGGTTARNLDFDFSSTKPSGTPKITVSCSTNSIYVCGVTITYGGGSTSTTTYKISPCTTYTISYADADGIAAGGSYSADVTAALAGTTITLEAEPARNYEFTGWTVTKAAGGNVTVTNDQFIMPASNVTVKANFTALCTGTLATPVVTATKGDQQIILTWQDVTGATGYEVTCSKGEGYTTECSSPVVGNITHSGTTNTCVISGLVNGLAYTTTVMSHSTTVCEGEAAEQTTTPDAEPQPTITVNGVQDLASLPVSEETELSITGGGYLTISSPVTIQSLTLYYGEDGHAQLSGIGNLTAERLDVVIQLPEPQDGVVGKWFAIAVPFEVSVASGIFIDGSDTPASYGYDFLLDEFDGNLRATVQQGWKYVGANDILQPGKMYMITTAGETAWRFSAAEPASITEASSAEVSEFASTLTNDGRHAGWNGIANTLFTNAEGGTDDTPFATVYNNTLGVYEPVTVGSHTFAAAAPFFVQVASDGEFDFSNPASSPVAHRVQLSEPSGYSTLTLSNEAGAYSARAFLAISDDKQDRYTIGRDLQQMAVSAPAVPQLWFEAYDMQLSAYETLLESERIVPVGLYAPAEGAYTLAMTDLPTTLAVCLMRNGQPVWDLSGSAVDLNLTQGNNDGYGLYLRRVKDVVTGISTAESTAVQKVLIGDRLFIIREGKAFTVTGIRLP